MVNGEAQAQAQGRGGINRGAKQGNAFHDCKPLMIQDRTPPKSSEPGTSDHRAASLPRDTNSTNTQCTRHSKEQPRVSCQSPDQTWLPCSKPHYGQETDTLHRAGHDRFHMTGMTRAVLTSGVEEGVRDHPHEVLDEGDELPRGLRPRGDHDLGGLRDDRRPRGSTIQTTTRQRSTARTETCHAQQSTEACRHEPSIGSALSRRPSSP